MSNQKKKSGIELSLKQAVVIVSFMMICIFFLPTAIFLLIAMLPTIVAFFVDRDKKKNKAFTIGVMNFAGAYYYILQIILNFPKRDLSFAYTTQAETIMIIYSFAALGYFIYWMVISLCSLILVEKSKSRLKQISEEKEKLYERWGKAVGNVEDEEEKSMEVKEED